MPDVAPMTRTRLYGKGIVPKLVLLSLFNFSLEMVGSRGSFESGLETLIVLCWMMVLS